MAKQLMHFYKDVRHFNIWKQPSGTEKLISILWVHDLVEYDCVSMWLHSNIHLKSIIVIVSLLLIRFNDMMYYMMLDVMHNAHVNTKLNSDSLKIWLWNFLIFWLRDRNWKRRLNIIFLDKKVIIMWATLTWDDTSWTITMKFETNFILKFLMFLLSKRINYCWS